MVIRAVILLAFFDIHIYIGFYEIVLILRRCVMAKSFTWERDMKKAIERSTAEKKPILLDFFSPG